MERILRGITSVSHGLEAKETKIMDLTTEAKTIHAEISGYQAKVEPVGKNQLNTHIHTYRENNECSIDFALTLLVAAKATIMGQLIRDAALSNRQTEEHQKALEADIVHLTHAYMAHPSPITKRSLEKTRMYLNTLFTSKAESVLQRLKYRY
ncbi:hypothetical protein NDU88_003532 [Pleurodeles waltl]|uniref:Uncharacterized protein n=1 Tax=Pleurodeles waltl TaxID=8319 RepID=A0AAV7SG17_PLEWA|nr:hypothetical protein NDU88_003532 [Pleurodeles waltl]